jgi:hypothetical protein
MSNVYILVFNWWHSERGSRGVHTGWQKQRGIQLCGQTNILNKEVDI